jgi:hypothetical protein
MEYNDFLKAVIDQGIEAAKADYTKPQDANRLDGSIEGFIACRNKTPEELVEVYNETNEYMHTDDVQKYWWYNCYRLEVMWVCNVVSAYLALRGGKPIPVGALPTYRGVAKACEILNKPFR